MGSEETKVEMEPCNVASDVIEEINFEAEPFGVDSGRNEKADFDVDSGNFGMDTDAARDSMIEGMVVESFEGLMETDSIDGHDRTDSLGMCRSGPSCCLTGLCQRHCR